MRHYQMGSLDKDVWRSGGSQGDVLAKWELMANFIEAKTPVQLPAMMPSTRPIRIAFGTTNPWKVRELNALMMNIPKEIRVYDFDIPEPFNTLRQNAQAKMDGYKERINPDKYDLLIVEDSGLFIEALNGAPGTHSARYSVKDESTETRKRAQIDHDNNIKLIKTMEGMSNRKAHFGIVCLVHSSQGITPDLVSESRAEGTIATEMRGTNGFGYDPVFEPLDSDGKTYAEFDGHRKNLRSHRRGVAREIANYVSREFVPRMS
jgi:XTP/dITP diphosphohydrolase